MARINSNNVNEKSIIDYIICNNKLTKHIAEVIVDKKTRFCTDRKEKN